MRTSPRLRLVLPAVVLVAVASLVAGACSTFAPPAWRVGDVSMSVDDFMAAFEASRGGGSAQASTTSTGRISTASLAEFMSGEIREELVKQGVADLGIDITEQDLQTTRQAFLQQGQSAPDEDEVLFQASVVKLGTKLVTDAIDAGTLDIDARIRQAYDDGVEQEQFTTPEQTCANVLIVRPGAEPAADDPAARLPDVTEADFDAAETVAEEAAERLETEDYGTVAAEVMWELDREQQTEDVVCLDVTRIEPEIAALFGEVGEISEPLRVDENAVGGNGGFVVVRVDRVEPERVTPFEEVESQLQQQIVQEVTGELLNTWVEDQSRRSSVFVDPRFGTWDTATASVRPPEGAASPTVPTLVPQGFSIDPSALPDRAP